MTHEVTMKVKGVEKVLTSLEEKMLGLTYYGKPRLSFMGDGWYCVIDMHVASLGAEFKIASQFDHTTPSEAAAECCKRVVKTLKDLTNP